jgi:MFS family permease
MVIGVSLFTGFSVVQQTLGYYFQDILALDAATTAKQVGYAMMGSAAFSLVAQFGIVQRLRWRAVLLMRLGLLSMLFGFVGLTLFHSLSAMITAMCFVGLGMGMAMPGFSSSASVAVTPQEQGAVAGLIASCPALGFIVGPVLGAALYQLHPYAPYGFASAMFVPLLLFAGFSQRLQR